MSLSEAEAAAVRTNPPEMMTADEIAAYLHCSLRTLKARVADRMIPSVKFGGRRMFVRSEILKAFTARQTPVRAY